MGTSNKNFDKLTAGVSTRADLISYFNANMDAIDALLKHIYVVSAGVGIGIPSPSGAILLSVASSMRVLDSFSGIHIATAEGVNYIESAGADMSGAADLNFTDMNASHIWLKIGYDGAIWASGNISADSFTDRTPAFQGDALSALAAIRASERGEIDHASLPEFAAMPYRDARGEWWPGRSLGDMVSVLVAWTQQYREHAEAELAKRDEQIAALLTRVDALESCLPH